MALSGASSCYDAQTITKQSQISSTAILPQYQRPRQLPGLRVFRILKAPKTFACQKRTPVSRTKCKAKRNRFQARFPSRVRTNPALQLSVQGKISVPGPTRHAELDGRRMTSPFPGETYSHRADSAGDTAKDFRKTPTLFFFCFITLASPAKTELARGVRKHDE